MIHGPLALIQTFLSNLEGFFALSALPVEGRQVMVVVSVFQIRQAQGKILFPISEPPINTPGMIHRPFAPEGLKACGQVAPILIVITSVVCYVVEGISHACVVALDIREDLVQKSAPVLAADVFLYQTFLQIAKKLANVILKARLAAPIIIQLSQIGFQFSPKVPEGFAV